FSFAVHPGLNNDIGQCKTFTRESLVHVKRLARRYRNRSLCRFIPKKAKRYSVISGRQRKRVMSVFIGRSSYGFAHDRNICKRKGFIVEILVCDNSGHRTVLGKPGGRR